MSPTEKALTKKMKILLRRLLGLFFFREGGFLFFVLRFPVFRDDMDSSLMQN